MEELFRFPTVMIDGDEEERKRRESSLMSRNETEYDIVYGEAEYPFWNFLGVEDRWLPTKESLQLALEGTFEACLVKFANIGQFLVPWSKRKFKNELIKFRNDYKAKYKTSSSPEIQIIKIEDNTQEDEHT